MKHKPDRRRRSARRGVLAFEWILLISLLVIGVIGGLSAVRDALISELKDLADCINSLSVSHDDDVDSTQPVTCDPSMPDPNCSSP